jgi:hypothetical protein
MAKAKPETVEAVVETAEESKATKAPKGVAKLEEEGDIAADYLEALLDIADPRAHTPSGTDIDRRPQPLNAGYR